MAVDNVVFVVPAALLWVSVLWRVPTLRRGPSERALWLALAALGLTATLEVPAVEQAVARLTPAEPNLGYLVKHVLIAGVALAAWEVLRGVTLPAPEAARGARRRAGTAAVVIMTLVALFLTAPVEADHSPSGFTGRYGSEPIMVAFWLVFLGWLGAALIQTIRLTWQYGKRAPRTPLRTGILLIGASAMACLGYVVYKSAYLLARASGSETGPVVGSYAPLSRTLIVASMLLIVTGCAWPAIRSSRFWRHADNWVRLRRLRPLWQAVYEATPAIALTWPSPHLERVRVRDLEVRLYRRVVEIRDGVLALRPFAPPDLRDRAREAALESGVPTDRVNPVAEAVWCEVARRVKLRGGPAVHAAPGDPTGGADLDSEVRILEQVSMTWRKDSALITELADRVDIHVGQKAGGRR